MGVYPSNHTKTTFFDSLKYHNLDDKVVSKFKSLPEIVSRKGDKFELQIVSTFISVGDMSYNFEMNYYSDNLVEYLFNTKVFGDIETSINFLLCELTENNYIKEGCLK